MSYRMPFSFTEMQGGYLHEDGQYTQENTLVLSIIDVEKEIIEEIAKDLCVFFHQESVMITQSSAEMYYIKALT